MNIKEAEIAPGPGERSAAKRRLLEQRLNGVSGGMSGNRSIPRRAPGGPAPLSFAQQQLWLCHQLDPESPLYNMTLAARLAGQLNETALRQALETLLGRHEVLRTRIESADGNPTQVIADSNEASLVVVDLHAGIGAESASDLGRLLDEEARRPFDLARDPLLRARLWRLAPQEHVLLITLHHIAADGWSWGVLLNEFGTVYGDFDAGRAVSLPDLPIQYADYAAWQRKNLRGENLARLLDYWTRQLAGAPDILSLPADRPRLPVQTSRGAFVSRRVDDATASAVRNLGRREGATLFMTLLAAFMALLHRYTRQTDILVGTPIAGRMQRETEGLIGMFVNTLALRGNLDGDPTFQELLQRVMDTTLGAFTHQDLPFEKLVEEMAPTRSSSHSPLVQVMFTLQNTPAPAPKLHGLETMPIETTLGTAKFDVTLVATEHGSGLEAGMEYNTDLFDASTVERMLEHWLVLLEGIAANPGCRLSELPLIGSAERQLVLVDWNRTQEAFRDNITAHSLFEEQARRSPDSLALSSGDREVTFGDLEKWANGIARRLRSLGVGPERLVGIFMERGPAMVAGFLGTWKAGGAYVPLDPGYPRERVAFMLRDTAAPVVLTTRELAGRLPETSATVLCIDTPADADDAGPARTSECGPDNLAYVIYTSGSSGVPKGVAVEHRSLCNLIDWYGRTYSAKPADRASQIASPSFDAAVWEIWPILTAGGSLHFPDEETRVSPTRLIRWIDERRITLAFMPTPLAEAALGETWPGALALRALQTGGDQLHRRPGADFPSIFVNHYGPTESTVAATWAPVQVEASGSGAPSIGRPISNCQVFVLDPQGGPLPIGVPGELHIGGAGLARGYLNRPDLTAAKFISNPFDTSGHSRLYRSGDLVRWLADGTLEFLGRLDQQVKIRGIRIELDEIESVLARHPAVRACAAVAPMGARGERQLAVCVVALTEPPPAAGDLRRFLAAALPDYMVPAQIRFMDALPTDPNGKVDRKALMAIDWSRTEQERAAPGPRDATERRLAEIWEEILGVRPVGVTERFFELGGHSILAVKVLARIEKAFGRKVPLASMFQFPTIGEFAALLRGQATPGKDSSLVEISGGLGKQPLFLVHGVGGGMFWGYGNLARHLGRGQPVLGFRSRGLDGREEHETIEEMAAHYLADLRAYQPHGPYSLGGYCFGGNVAWEMSRQLELEGERVDLLTLMNCVPTGGRYRRGRLSPLWLGRYLWNLSGLLGNISRADPKVRREYLAWKWRTLRRHLARPWAGWRNEAAELDTQAFMDLSNYPSDQRKLWAVHGRALCRHRTKPYSGRVLLLRSRVHQLYCSFDHDYGWREFAPGRLDVKVVPGGHESILEEPHVEELAHELELGLEDARRSQETGTTP